MKIFHWERSALYRKAVLALALVCIALAVHEIFGEHGLLALRRQQKEVQSLEQQIEQLRQQNQQLERQIKALESDPAAIERQAREQLRLARPGELIYLLPEKPSKPEPPATAPK